MIYEDLMNKDIFIFGGGQCGKALYYALQKFEISPNEIIDNNPDKWGKLFEQHILISGPSKLSLIDKKDSIIIIAVGRSSYVNVLEQLEASIKNAEIINYQVVMNFLAKKYYATKPNEWRIDYKNSIEKWLHSCQREISSQLKSIEIISKEIPQRDERIQRLDNFLKEDDIFMDIGCGATLKYTNCINGKGIRYLPIDALAPVYLYGQMKCNVTMPNRIQFAFAEHLTCFYKEDFADIINFDNSLDHCINPLRCLIECFRVLKIGGCLSLEHNAVEGKIGAGTGLHQWDFFMTENEEFVIANNENKININKFFGEAADISTYETYSDRYHAINVCVNLIKKKELPDVLISKYDADIDCGIIISSLFNKFVSNMTD